MTKDSRLRLTEICCKIKLGRTVTLTQRIWMSKLIESDSDAFRLAERFLMGCHHSTAVVQGFCKAKVGGSNPSDGILYK